MYGDSRHLSVQSPQPRRHHYPLGESQIPYWGGQYIFMLKQQLCSLVRLHIYYVGGFSFVLHR